MSKNRSTRKPRFEQLEGRQMMTGDTAVIPNMIVDTDFEDPVDEIADIRMQAIETLFANDTADIQNGKLVADDSVVYLTEDEMIPTPENPIRIQFDAELGAHLDNRIKIGTRTDGTVGGDFKHLFEQGVDFTVEQESISIYVHETTDAGQRLGERIVPQKTIGRLDPNTTYTIIAEDYGTHAALTVKNGDTVVAYLEGNITQLSPRGAQVAIRQQTGSTELPPALIDNLTIQHGTKEVCVPADPEARIAELQGQIAALDTEIAERGADAKEVVAELVETFDALDTDRWSTIQGGASVSGGALQLHYGNSRVQLNTPTVREDGEEKTTTMKVYIQSNDRYVWNPAAVEGAVSGQRIDVITGRYVRTEGPAGFREHTGNIASGVFTVTQVENNDGVTVTVTAPNNQTYTFTRPLDTVEGQHEPTIYGWKNIQVQEYSEQVIGTQTLGEKKAALQTELDALIAKNSTSVDVEAITKQIATLDTEISDTKAVVVTKQQQRTTLEGQLAEQIQARKDAEGAIETVIPSFTLHKPKSATYASVSFSDAEVGSEMIVYRDRDKAIMLRRTLTETSGSIGLSTPPSDDRVAYQVYIVSPEGTKAHLSAWDTWYGKNLGDLTHSSMSDTNRLLLQYDKPGDIDIDAIDAEIARLQGLITTLKTEIADLEIEIAALEVEKATLGVSLDPESHDAKIEEVQKKIALTDLHITKWGRAHKEGDEPALGEQETQLSTALGLVESSEKERSAIAQEVDNFKTEIANKEEFILKENAKEATAQHIINTWLQQEGDEAFKVTPTTRVAATRFQSFFMVYTEDMPAGYSIRFAGRDVYPITQADSKIEINGLPRPNIHIDYDVDLLDADGNLVRRLTSVKVYNGQISRVGTQDTSTSLTELAYIPEVPEDERVTEAQYTQALVDKPAAIAARTAAEGDIVDLEAKIIQKTDEMYDVQREQVPDNRMHVTSSGETFSMHFRSKHKQSYFEIDIQHNPGHFTRRTIEHPAGMQDGIFTFSMHNHIPAGVSGAVTITMYSDESKTELIGAFSGNYYHDHRVTGASPGEWDGMSTQERIALYEQNIAELNAAILHHGSAYKEADGPTLGEQKTTLELELEKAIDAKKYAEFQEHGLGRLLRIHQQLSAESLERGEHVTPETLTDAAFYLAGIGEDINDLAFALDQLDEETQKQYRPMLEEATSSFLVMADAVSEEISDLLPDIQDATALLSSSAEVTTGTYSRHIDVALTTLQGLLRIASWKTQDAEGALAPADGSTVLQGLSSLDFAQVEGLVQAASFTYSIPDGVTVTARMYHGGKQVGSESLTGSGTFSYEDETGITAVILTPSTNDASYSISDVALTADANDIFEADQLGSKENGYLSREIAPDFGKPEYILRYPMWENIMADNGGFWPRGGYDGAPQGYKYILPYDVGDTYSSYALLRPESGNGSATLGQPFYINDIEPYYHPLEAEFYTLVDGGIILHPGAPRMTAVTIATGSNVHIILDQMADDIDGLVTRLNTFDPYIEIHKIKNEWAPVEGFVAGSFSVPEGETPVLAYGQPFQIYAELVNRTGVGGTVTVQVYAGSEADPQKTLMSTHETTIGAYEKKGFIANARAQGDLETEGRPAISIVVTLPDGSQLVDGAHGRKAGRKSAADRMAAKEERKADMEAAEFASLPADVQSRVYLDYGTAQRAALMSRLSDAQRLSVLNAVNAEILGTSSHPVVREIQRSRASGGQVADIRAEHFPQLSFEQAADVVHAIEGETLNEEGLEILNQYTVAMADGIEGIMNQMNYIQGFLLADGPVQTVPVTESGTMRLYFDVHEREMVNFHLNGSLERNVDMFLSGGSLLRVGGLSHYAEIEQNSEKAIGSAESVSQVLEPGRYWVNITDATNYREGESFAQGPFNVDLHIERTPLNTANIEGMISIDGESKAQPVSLSVAEFDENGQRKTDYDTTAEGEKINKLDPNKRVLVVIHGRSSNEGERNINDLTLALTEYSKNHDNDYQVVTLDWSDAAGDYTTANGINPLHDAMWTPAVGKWAASQLMALGIPAEHIDYIVHSHGSYVGYYAADHMQKTGYGTVHGIVALDPAENAFGASGLDISGMSFSEVAKNSISLQATVDGEELTAKTALKSIYSIFRSALDDLLPGEIIDGTTLQTMADIWKDIEYGSGALARTAHQAYQLSGFDIEHGDAHNFPISLLTQLIRNTNAGSNALENSMLDLDTFLSNAPGALSMDPSRPFEGNILVHQHQDTDDNGEPWQKASPQFIDFRDSSKTDVSYW